MDDSTSQTQQQQQVQSQTTSPSATSTAPRNVKNLSIKDFFTTRLMRTRSFEAGGGGGANSPKDEATNWFDEFKARMIRKSQANKQAVKSTVEETSDEPQDLSESATKLGGDDVDDDYLVKDTCDIASGGGDKQAHEFCETDELSQNTAYGDTSSLMFKAQQRANLRARKLQRISSVESPDFDTASINTIFNRRDSRYQKVLQQPYRIFIQKFLNLFKLIISHLLPFNYNLPWKLLTLINIAFVIIVIVSTRQHNPDFKTFNFFYGFISGLIIAACCFMIIIISLLVHVLPKSQDSSPQIDVRSSFSGEEKSTTVSSTPKQGIQFTKPLISSEQKSDDFSTFEVLESELRDQDSASKSENVLDDDNYKGWMIEFIGDYELRNKSDFKLKLIFVKMENRVLYLCKPKNSDAESATFPVFIQQRVYDLNAVRKFSANLLLPKNVRNRQKWVWSKKYPIKLEFEDEVEPIPKLGEPAKVTQLTLFAKSCREKEEWFRRFKVIVEENRLARGGGGGGGGNASHKRASLQSNLSDGNNEEEVVSGGSFRNLLSRSPSPLTPSTRVDSVQTSRSSHILDDLKKSCAEDNQTTDSGSNLTRTKSCELFHPDQGLNDNDSDLNDCGKTRYLTALEDDSTLTRETAEMFSRAVEYTNFLESRPNFDYREYIERVIDSSKDATNTSDWFNSLTGRIFFDVVSQNYWSLWFKRKIQRKLHRIRLPYFMETLTLTQIDLGNNAPQFLNVVSHCFDSFGLSIDFDMAYSGGLTMTFETKLNLLKIKNDNANQSAINTTTNVTTNNSQNSTLNQTSESSSKEGSCTGDSNSDTPSKSSKKVSSSSSGSTRTSGESSDSDGSESDSSSDSSDDEADVDEISDWEDYGAEKTRQSIVRFVDKIASSRYFQQATENKYIKKKLQDISNCPLVLVVKIQSLNGVLTVNVPPPQTNRIWYGFKPNPELILKALPKMGDREVNLSHVTDWIEKKLAEEFRKILVIPNMEDVVLPILKSDHLSYVTSTR